MIRNMQDAIQYRDAREIEEKTRYTAQIRLAMDGDNNELVRVLGQFFPPEKAPEFLEAINEYTLGIMSSAFHAGFSSGCVVGLEITREMEQGVVDNTGENRVKLP